DLIPRLDTEKLDLILVEGFKHEVIPKVELYRPALEKPLLHPNDSNIIAIATDEPLNTSVSIDQIDLNNIAEMADYIQTFIANWKA
ncbi:MAG: molybdenum cofactor guanylyltransferase, partial [Methylophaga sp.]|nr:molybdenum cofactor guanylyltransferase [Methylophaga sp.]